MGLTIGKRLFGLVLVVALCASAFLAIAILLFGEFDETQARILGTTALIGLFSLLALPGGVLLDQGRDFPFAWALIGLAGISFIVAMTLVWGDTDSDDLWKAAGSAAAVTGAFSQTATTLSRRRAADSQSVVILFLLSVAAVSLLALLILIAIWQSVEDNEGFYRFLGAVAVLDLLLVLLQPVARRMGGNPAAVPAGSMPGHAYRVVFTLDEAPSEAAVEEARQALERGGVTVREVEREP